MSLVTHDQVADGTAPHTEPPPPPAAPLPWVVRRDAHKARLADLDAELQTNVTELQVKIRDARNAQMAAKAALEAEYATELEAREARIADKAIRGLSGAIDTWYAQPKRALLRAIGEEWQKLKAEVEAELGSPASHLMLALASAKAFGRLPSTWRTHGAGGASSSYVGDVASALAKAFEQSDAGAAEGALDRLCQLTRTQPIAFDARIEDYQRCVTQGAFSCARETHRLLA